MDISSVVTQLRQEIERIEYAIATLVGLGSQPARRGRPPKMRQAKPRRRLSSNALLGNQSSSEWNIGPAENFHRVRRGISEPFAITHHWSNSHSPNNRFVIALHSPDRNHQTGPPVGPPEKSAAQRAY